MKTMIEAVLVGAGATLCIDLWALLLKRAFGVPSLDYCLLGRWVLHMFDGKFAHAGIAASAARPGECRVGWSAHYSIGVAFAVMYLLVAPTGWLAHPTIGPPLAFGVATVVVPFLTMQPAFGLGIAASRTAHPWRARLKSVATHAVFGVGLYLGARVLTWLR